jgi:hypothetical protein
MDPVTDPDPVFWWPKIEDKNTAEFFFFFFRSKIAKKASIKDVQATGEALNIEHPALQKMKFIYCFLFI